MRLIALLVVLVLAGWAMGRMGGVLTPGPGPSTPPSRTMRQVQQASDAASQAERQRLEQAMKALR